MTKSNEKHIKDYRCRINIYNDYCKILSMKVVKVKIRNNQLLILIFYKLCNLNNLMLIIMIILFMVY